MRMLNTCRITQNGKTSAVKPVAKQNCTKNHVMKRVVEQKNHAVKKGSKFVTKNMLCVNGTTEITLERIQCNIVTNLQCQNCSEFTLCVSRP